MSRKSLSNKICHSSPLSYPVDRLTPHWLQSITGNWTTGVPPGSVEGEAASDSRLRLPFRAELDFNNPPSVTCLILDHAGAVWPDAQRNGHNSRLASVTRPSHYVTPSWLHREMDPMQSWQFAWIEDRSSSVGCNAGGWHLYLPPWAFPERVLHHKTIRSNLKIRIRATKRESGGSARYCTLT